MPTDREGERGMPREDAGQAPPGRAQEAQRRGAPRWRGSGAWIAVVIGVLAAIAVVWIVAAAFAGGAVLVLPPPGSDVELSEGDPVRVTGTVRDVDEDLGGAGAFDEFEGEGYIAARSIEPVADEAVEGGDLGADDIVTDDELQGERVTVTGTVERADVGDGAFTLDVGG